MPHPLIEEIVIRMETKGDQNEKISKIPWSHS